MIGTSEDGLMVPCLNGTHTTPPIVVLVPEPEGLLNLNDSSKYPVPLFDIGQPHRLAHSDGLKRDPLSLPHNSSLGCHLGPHGHIVLLSQRCIHNNHVGSLGDVHRHYLAMNPIGPPVDCPTVRRNTEQYHQRSDCE